MLTVAVLPSLEHYSLLLFRMDSGVVAICFNFNKWGALFVPKGIENDVLQKNIVAAAFGNLLY